MPTFAVVIGNVLHEPVDGVVSIGRFVDVLGRGFGFQDGAHVHERSFRAVFAAHILEREDEFLLGVVVHRPAWIRDTRLRRKA